MHSLGKHTEYLIISLKRGDQNAFRQIYDLYQKRIYLFARTITKSDYASEDIVQEVFVRLWMKRETIGVAGSFDSFLFTITKNLALNYLRKASNQRSLQEELWRNLSHIGRETEDILLSQEYEDLVNDILENIPVQKRSIFILSKQQGKSNQEIAELLGISPKTVKNHLWKTLQIIRVQLKPHLTNTPISTLLAAIQFIPFLRDFL